MAGATADAECVAFPQWALPQVGRRWEGYRKVRERVCRVVRRRAADLGLGSLPRYRTHLEENPAEWAVLDALVDVTISRFYRDRSVFDALRDDVFPRLVERAGSRPIRVWSNGCPSGEEPYTLALMWWLSIAPDAAPGRLRVLGTDISSAAGSGASYSSAFARNIARSDRIRVDVTPAASVITRKATSPFASSSLPASMRSWTPSLRPSTATSSRPRTSRTIAGRPRPRVSSVVRLPAASARSSTRAVTGPSPSCSQMVVCQFQSPRV